MLSTSHLQTLAPPINLLRQRWLVGALLSVFVLVSVQYYFKIDDEQRSAILRWRPQIQQLFDVNIYEQFTYPNPPIMALLLKPIIELPPIVAGLTWFYLKVGMALLAIVWAFRLVETPEQPFPLSAKVLTIVLSLRPILGDLTHGNVNLFILFLAIAALYAYHRGWDVLTGIVLGLAIACKVTPALFLAYFLWKRAARVLLGGFLGLLLFLLLIPGTFLGYERNVELLTSWYDCMVKPFVVSSEVTTEHLNQSLPGLVYRWFTDNPSTIEDGRAVEYRTRLVLDPFWVKAIIKGCMAAFGLLVIWTCHTSTQPRHGWRLAAEFSLVFLGMLMFSERTWKHHCVTLLLPFAVLAYHVILPNKVRWIRGYLVGSLIAATLLMTTTSSGVSDVWDRAAKNAHADGAYVWAYVVLIAALAVLLRTMKPHPFASSREPDLGPH